MKQKQNIKNILNTDITLKVWLSIMNGYDFKAAFLWKEKGRASEVGGDGAARWGSKVGIVMIFSIHG